MSLENGDSSRCFLASGFSGARFPSRMWMHPSLPKSSKYLVRGGDFEPLKTLLGGVWKSKHLLTGYLDD